MNLGEKNEAKIIGKFTDNPVRLAVFHQVQQQGKIEPSSSYSYSLSC